MIESVRIALERSRMFCGCARIALQIACVPESKYNEDVTAGAVWTRSLVTKESAHLNVLRGLERRKVSAKLGERVKQLERLRRARHSTSVWERQCARGDTRAARAARR